MELEGTEQTLMVVLRSLRTNAKNCVCSPDSFHCFFNLSGEEATWNRRELSIPYSRIKETKNQSEFMQNTISLLFNLSGEEANCPSKIRLSLLF